MRDLKERLAAWYNLYIVKGWYKTYTFWLSAAALVGPELPGLLQMVLDNFDTFSSAAPVLSDGTKATIRVALLIAIPIARAIKQNKLPPKE